MKTTFTRKALALLLAVCMVLSLGSTALAAQEQSIPFRQVEADVPLEREPADLPQDTSYAPTDLVRVSIVLEDRPGLEQMEASSGLSTAALAVSPQMQQTRQSLEANQAALARRISNQVLGGEPLDVVWNLTLAANLISANVQYEQIEAIQAVPGVKEVVLETRYEPAVYSQGTADPSMATSGEMIGTSAAYAAGYTGAGMRIAVIDTGTDTDHKSFDADAFAYALAEDEKASGEAYDLLDAAEIGAVLPQLNAYKRTLQNGKPTAATPTVEQLYGTAKLPFHYNYVDGDLDVTHDNDDQGEHGSHVAGIATANRYIKTEDGFVSALEAVKVQGVAPDAQLITMKVFGKNGGAYDSDYMAAIEDAILLGCDVVNLSLGSSNPGNTYNETYQSFLEQLKETDTVVAVAAGNAGTWADGAWNGHLYSDSVSLDMVGFPGSYTNSFTVASADNVGYTGQYLAVGTRQIFYTETASNAPSITTLAGQTLDYVLLEGTGDYGAWDGIDLTGKVAVCARGDINFSQKAQNAADAGAAAVLIYNNEAGSINMDLSDYTGSAPCVSITQADGAWMKEQAEAVKDEAGETWYYTGTLTVAEGASSVVYDTPVTMSDFSSWGVPGSLELKPEITAPGGNIYSVNGVIPGGESYETMSGTSMASPQIAGMTALVAQYMEEAGLQEQTGLSTRVLAQSLLMSTAEPLMDVESGSYYPAIQQGAGLANVGSAISASSYVLVDGQPDGKVKAELGDDPERTGKYQFRFTLSNLTDESQEYLLSAALFTQDLFEDYASESDQWLEEIGEEFETAWYLSKTTTTLDADVTWTVDGKTVEADSRLIHMDFDGNGTVNRDDAQALLDYIAGNREEIFALDYADLDGSGAVTTYDAYLLLEGLNGGTVTLPAGGKTDITVTMTLTEAQKKALDEKYESGAYVQGYVFAAPTATSEGVQSVTHSIPVLAFYGNWTDASMFENESLYVYDAGANVKSPYMGSAYVNAITGISANSSNSYIWGGNPVSNFGPQENYLPERASLNNQNGDALCQYFVNPIRNAASGKVQIFNPETGEIYKERNLDGINSGFYYSASDAWIPSQLVANLTWQGTNAKGEPLPEGTKAQVQLTLVPEYYVNPATGQINWEELGEGASISLPVTIDNTAPEITGVSIDPIQKTLTVTAKDNHYIAACIVQNPDNGGIFSLKTPNQQTGGETVEISVTTLGSFTGDRLRIFVYDYAANVAAYDISLGELLGNVQKGYTFGSFWFGEWLQFNQDSEDEFGEQVSEVGDIIAATNADGYVFSSTSGGRLYVQTEDLRSGAQYIRTLETAPTDLAYNPADGYLYGISEADGLVRIDKRTGESTMLGNPGIRTSTLACDESGTFYSLSCDDNGLYRFTLEAMDTPELLGKPVYTDMDEWTGEEITVEPVATSTGQSLEWNCNDGLLYWTQYDSESEDWFNTAKLFQIHPETAACQKQPANFFDDPVVALFVRDLDRHEDAGWSQMTEQVEQVALSASTMTLKTKEEAQLEASVLPWTASNREVTWTSSNSAVVAVDETGGVTALSAGVCTVTATSALDPSFSASCQVTVEPVDLTLKGVVRREGGQAQLFTWDMAQNDGWTAGPTVEAAPISAAYEKRTNHLYVQGADRNYTMRQVDESTGKTLLTSGPVQGGLPSWDMAVCEYLGQPDDAVSIYGPYIGSPGSLADNAQLTSGFDLSGYLTMTTNCSSFVAIASGGYEQVTAQSTLEDGTTVDIVQDTERFYLLDAAGYLWILNLYALENDGYGCYITGLLSTDLAGKLPFLQEGDFQYCSMVEDQQTGHLVLSYFTGDTSELFLLYAKEPDSLNLTAVRLGNLGDQNYPAVLYCAESNGEIPSSQSLNGCVLPILQAELPMKQLDLSALQETQEISAGTLHSATNQQEQPVNGKLQSLPQETVQAPQANEKTISIQIPAPQDSTNGLVHLTYDPALLTLDTVTPYAGLSSVNRETDGQVTLAYAGIPGLSGNSAAEVTFRVREDASGVTKVTCNTLEQGSQIGTQEQPVSTATFTYALSGGQVTGSAGHDCPSLRFRDLKAQWYHEAIDEALNKGLVNGMTEDLFQPEGTLTRAQFVTILHRLASCPGSSQDTPFTDLRSGSFYEEAVRWAYEKGYINGTSQSTFSPNAPLIREMAATILWRMAGSPASSQALDGFTDAAQIHPYAQTAMAWAVEQAIVVGATATTLAPLSTATRAQGVVLVMRYAER